MELDWWMKEFVYIPMLFSDVISILIVPEDFPARKISMPITVKFMYVGVNVTFIFPKVGWSNHGDFIVSHNSS